MDNYVAAALYYVQYMYVCIYIYIYKPLFNTKFLVIRSFDQVITPFTKTISVVTVHSSLQNYIFMKFFPFLKM